MPAQFPLDIPALGRGFGFGWNRARTRQDQLHGGQDFQAREGTPIKAPVASIVEAVGSDTGRRISWAQATQGVAGAVRGMSGYGNFVVLRHENMSLPGISGTFWTSYNHLSQVSVQAGQRVDAGQLLGFSGHTNNGKFRGMGAHLHVELRRRPFPGSYERDTVDPQIFWNALGLSLERPRPGLSEYEPPIETDDPSADTDAPSDVIVKSTKSIPLWPILGGAALLLFVLIGGSNDSVD